MIGAKPIAAYIELLSLLRRNSSRMSNVKTRERGPGIGGLGSFGIMLS